MENVYIITLGPFRSPNVIAVYSTNREENIIFFKVGDNDRLWRQTIEHGRLRYGV